MVLSGAGRLSSSCLLRSMPTARPLPIWPPSGARHNAEPRMTALMPSILSTPSGAVLRRSRRVLSFSALPLLLALSGCGGDNASNAALLPPCPRPVLLDDAADLTQFRPTGRDITDMVLNARITGLNGACKPGGRSQLATSVTVNFQ